MDAWRIERWVQAIIAVDIEIVVATLVKILEYSNTEILKTFISYIANCRMHLKSTKNFM